MTSLFLLVLQLLTVPSLSLSQTVAKPGCKDHCGKVTVPYPFGMGTANCYYNASYEIVCNDSFHPPKPFLRQYNYEVMNINGVGYNNHHTLTARIPTARNICTSDGKGVPSTDLRGSPYRFSRDSNTFWVWGCSGRVLLKNRDGKILGQCTSFCSKNANVSYIKTTNCYGVGCCKISLEASTTTSESTTGLDYYEIDIDHQTAPTRSNACKLVGALVQNFSVQELRSGRLPLSQLRLVTTSLEWHATYLTHSTSDENSFCEYYQGFARCYCNWPCVGNPYFPNGCKVARGCQKCRSRCAYNDKTQQYYCEKNLINFLMKRASIFGFSSGAGLVLLILGCYWNHRLVKGRRENKQKAEHFERNGGLLLQQQMSSGDGVVEKMTIFTMADLKKATDNFHESKILGQGGQGTVYKGTLMDGSIVAIKKSMKVDEDHLDQFINEMVILSQINHRNVVKLLGCCLETEVPLLVYEFIPNGALYQHIHDPIEGFHATWKIRLQIAAESAEALAYLHSSSSTPIYHKDIKSSNILLDDKYRAKVSDFGISRAINIEQTHVTTRVHGTYGYLDPEYFQSNQFSQKSDVYSFGVVLVELLTGKKPIYPTECGEWKSLAIEFRCQMEKSHLSNIVDKQIIKEGKEEEFIAVANLAKQCLNMKGRQRPTMKEVVRILDQIRSPSSKQQNSVSGKCLVIDINDNGPSSIDMVSTHGSFSSFSIAAQPLTVMFRQ